MFDAAPEAFGSYRVLEQLRPGRFGPVYRGRDETTGLTVAIKTVDGPLEPEQAEVLASAVGRLAEAPLQHPSIVPILAAAAAGGRVWIVEPWFGSPALDGLMRRHGAQPLADVLFHVTQLAAALDFAAAVGVYHGVLHPRDILSGDDRTVVSGVGVLQAFGEAGIAVPMHGAYVSPQRRQGLPPSAADDVFALAWITYELVCGTTLPAGSALRAAMPGVPGVDRAAFAELIELALSDDPQARPASALAFAEALQAVVRPAHATEPSSASPLRDSEPPPIWDAEPNDDIPMRVPEPPVDGVEAPAGIEEMPTRSEGRRVPAPTAELALRPAEPTSDPVIRERATEPRLLLAAESRSPEYGYWFPIALTLAIGLLMGFASGYVVGQRERIPAPHAAERPVTRNDAAAAPETPRARTDVSPAPTGGQAYTESVVPPEGSSGEPPAPPAAPSASPEGSSTDKPEDGDGTQPVERVDPTTPGVLQVESRPRGARVFIDGRLVGTTPLVVADVRPGQHAVRIDLAGHRRWVTTIDLAPGERQRVAASLER